MQALCLDAPHLLVSGLFRHNEAYTWTNPTCCVHNVIIGKLWIEQYGVVEILNHRWLCWPLPPASGLGQRVLGWWRPTGFGPGPAEVISTLLTEWCFESQ